MLYIIIVVGIEYMNYLILFMIFDIFVINTRWTELGKLIIIFFKLNCNNFFLSDSSNISKIKICDCFDKLLATMYNRQTIISKQVSFRVSLFLLLDPSLLCYITFL